MSRIVRSLGEFFLDIFETLVIALSLFLVVYLFFMQPHQVNGKSMVPNFQDGEYLLTDKISYRIGEPSRGDVVVFHAPEQANCPQGTGCDFIKRVIGLPGETISVRDNAIFVDGQQVPEAYIPPENVTQAGTFTKGRDIVLGSNEYFVVGDNRPYSSDSRAWGPIAKTDIVGRAFFRYWPANMVGFLPQVQYR